jgi:hypothetical protein
MRQLVSIKTVTAINPIKDADKIVEAIIDNGWGCVVKKEEFVVGDKCVYFEIDSLLPMSDPRFKFLEKNAKGYNGIAYARLRSIKLKKTLSQGLALPLKDFPELATSKDYAETLKVAKWEDPDEMKVEEIKEYTWRDALLKYLPIWAKKRVYKYLYQKTSGSFPSWIPRTDSERVQNFSSYFADEFNMTQKYEITIKEDGSSISVYRNGNELGVCSRNLTVWKRKVGFWSKLFAKKAVANENKFYSIAKVTGLVDAVEKLGRNIAVQGEYVGPSMNGNRSGRSDLNIFVFDIYDIDKQRYCSVEERREIYQKLVSLGYKGTHVHVVAEGTLKDLKLDSIKALLEYAIVTRFPGIDRNIEGVVVKRWDGSMNFKAISNEYLINHNL